MLPCEQPWKLPKLQRVHRSLHDRLLYMNRVALHCTLFIIDSVVIWIFYLASIIKFRTVIIIKMSISQANKLFLFSPFKIRIFVRFWAKKWGWNSQFSCSIKTPFSTRSSLRVVQESNSEFSGSVFSHFLGRVHVSFMVILWMISSFYSTIKCFYGKKTYKEKNETQSTSSKLFVRVLWLNKTAIFSKMFRDWRNFNNFF